MKPPLVRILVVEDDPDIRAIAHLSLTSVGGFTVALCPSGEEALQIGPTFAPDLILLDVMMPDMDGPATLAKLKEHPALSKVPVVFITAKIQPQEVRRYHELGAVDVVAKPFDPMILPTTLQAIWEATHG